MISMKQNWFSRMALVIASGALLYLFQFMIRSQYVILKGTYGFVGVAAILAAAAGISAWLFMRSRKKPNRSHHLTIRAERICVSAVFLFSFAIRIAYIFFMPMEPQSDYLRYTEVAEYIASGTILTEGSAYCDYIAMFPGTIGYSLLLALIYQVTGIPNIYAGLIVNAILAEASSFFCWRIVRHAAEKKAGLVALTLSAFFPSQIFFSNVLASEYVFVFLMMLALWLLVMLLDALQHKNILRSALFAVLCGAMISVSQNVRAIAGIIVVAGVICLLSMRGKQLGRIRFAPLGCALLMLCSFSLTGSLCSSGIESLVQRKIEGGIENSAWYLYVGLNRETAGEYNPEDVAFFNEMKELKGTPAEAKKAMLEAAIERATGDIRSLPKLFVRKFENLWGDDGFSCDYNLIYMDEEHLASRKGFLQNARILCSMYYFAMLAFTGMYVVKAWKRKKLDIGYPMLLLWLGTIAAHLLLENMNRYHYHVLSLFPILAALALFNQNEKRAD